MKREKFLDQLTYCRSTSVHHNLSPEDQS